MSPYKPYTPTASREQRHATGASALPYAAVVWRRRHGPKLCPAITPEDLAQYEHALLSDDEVELLYASAKRWSKAATPCGSCPLNRAAREGAAAVKKILDRGHVDCPACLRSEKHEALACDKDAQRLAVDAYQWLRPRWEALHEREARATMAALQRAGLVAQPVGADGAQSVGQVLRPLRTRHAIVETARLAANDRE